MNCGNKWREIFWERYSAMSFWSEKSIHEEILNVQRKIVGEGSLVWNTDTFYLLELLKFYREKIEENALMTNY